MPDPENPPQPSLSTGTQPQLPDGFLVLVVPAQKFNLGRMVITSNAQSRMTPEDVSTGLLRHSNCDWGEVCDKDRRVNERGVLDQGMILSVYQSAKGEQFWVITDPGHEVTTVLLPEDY